MTALALARWTLLEMLRRPGTWAALAVLGAAWPATLTFGPLGITTRDAPPTGHLYEIGFLAALYGVSAGVGLVARTSWLLERADPARRLVAEAGALVGAALAPLAAAFVPALLLAPEVGRPLAPERLVAVPLTLIHLVALGLVALRLPAAPALRCLLVPFAAWLTPAVLGPGGALRDTLCNLLDAARHGRVDPELLGDSPHRGAAILPITALLLVAWRLAARAPSVHALRNPR